MPTKNTGLFHVGQEAEVTRFIPDWQQKPGTTGRHNREPVMREEHHPVAASSARLRRFRATRSSGVSRTTAPYTLLDGLGLPVCLSNWAPLK